MDDAVDGGVVATDDRECALVAESKDADGKDKIYSVGCDATIPVDPVDKVVVVNDINSSIISSSSSNISSSNSNNPGHCLRNEGVVSGANTIILDTIPKVPFNVHSDPRLRRQLEMKSQRHQNSSQPMPPEQQNFQQQQSVAGCDDSHGTLILARTEEGAAPHSIVSGLQRASVNYGGGNNDNDSINSGCSGNYFSDGSGSGEFLPSDSRRVEQLPTSGVSGVVGYKRGLGGNGVSGVEHRNSSWAGAANPSMIENQFDTSNNRCGDKDTDIDSEGKRIPTLPVTLSTYGCISSNSSTRTGSLDRSTDGGAAFPPFSFRPSYTTHLANYSSSSFRSSSSSSSSSSPLYPTSNSSSSLGNGQMVNGNSNVNAIGPHEQQKQQH